MATNTNGASSSNAAQGSNAHANGIIAALGNAFKSQTGDILNNSQIAKLLQSNIGQLSQLAKEGKLSQQQILQLKDFADRHRAAQPPPQPTGGPASTQVANAAAGPPSTPISQPTPQTQPVTQATAQPGFKTSSPGPVLGADSTSTLPNVYAISQTLNPTNPGPVQWPSAQQGRPTLTGGIAGGRMSGTPAQIARSTDDVNMLNLDDHRSRRKNTPGDQSMRRSIQDLVSSVDPNVKIDMEVEDLLLTIADEFIDSVTTFGCRLAKHRGGDTLEVRDLQLHLERNHNIRIPGFASDETRISLSQSSVAPAVPAATAAKKSGGQQGTQMTLRSHRLAQVAQAKREAKLI